MNLIKRYTVLCKALIVISGFFALIVFSAGDAKAQNPSASFTSNVFVGCAPLSVDFTNLSTQATDYSWDFGNGNISTLADPTTVYLTSGYYTVILVAINSVSGITDTLFATNYIHVLDEPIANFTASPLSACAGNNTISFTNLSQFSNNYIWDFGDGNFSTQLNPTHTYANPGTYNIKLIAKNPFGCSHIQIKNNYITIYPNPPAAFTVNQQSSCDPLQVFNFNATSPGSVAWAWNFGDGNTSNLQNPSHVYGASGSYTVSLIVFNGNGCSDTLVQPGYINIGPTLVPTFNVSSQAGCFPLTTDFTCTVPGANSWLWNFGDGATSTNENPSHTYLASGSYTITLTVTTSIGCNGTVVLPGYITVDQLPVPSFVVSDPLGCSPHTTPFTNTSSNAVTYSWDFGNGITSTDTDPSAFYPDTGTYNVTLTAYSANGCQASVTQNAAVSVKDIQVAFSGIPRNGCAPLPVNFTSSSTPSGVSWNWNFGDGFTANTQNPTHTYTANGSYIVSLVVTSSIGCTDTLVKTNYIKVVPGTTPYTLPDTILVCMPPGSASFSDPTTGSNSWLWNFGDGTTATVKNPTHVYTAPGVYVVTLNTSMAGGCSQTFNPFAIVNVLIFEPLPIISIIPSACAPFVVNLNNLTPNVVAYLWDFGDGTTSTLQNPSHTYAQQGIYNISLLLTSNNGCQASVSTTVTFGHQNVITVSDTTNCLGDIVNFGLQPAGVFTSALWNFGDGNTSNQLQPSHLYAAEGAYNVSVSVTDTSGCSYNYTYINPVYISNPIPSFTINQPTSGCVPYDVQFINNSTGAVSYTWNFGDGSNSSNATPLHTYTSPGIYTVILGAFKKGCVRKDTIFNFITVNEAVANLSFTPDTGCVPFTATFTDLSVNAVSWLWNFGDGSTSNSQNPVHTFNTDPADSLLLTIVDVNGCSDTYVAVNAVGISPDIQVSDTYACKSTAINFNTSLVASSYLWDFGDGSTSNIQNPVHVYTQNGTFTVSLTCILASGCTAATVSPGLITINSPTAAFMSPTVAVCAPSLVSFTNQSIGATSWHWNFGDGTTSTNENPSNIYSLPGTYTVTLVAYSDSGCVDSIALSNYISVPGTLTDFSISTLAVCPNAIVQFTDLSINAATWFWNFGDGFTSTAQNPMHQYTDSGGYTVTLITSDSVGCVSFQSSPNPINIYPSPEADGTLDPVSGCIPVTVNFTNASVGGISYTWHFGNGDSAVVSDTSYTYTIPGIYYPNLVAVSAYGCTDTFTYAPGVTASGSPIPAFTMSQNVACAPATISFNNTSTGLLNPIYTWVFGNGQTSALKNPTTVYNNPGVYQVSLVVANGGGCSDTIVHTITIVDQPIASGSASGNSGCTPYPVTFTNNSTNAITYLWNFGDGNTSTDSIPVHTYSASGTYTVTLIAFGLNGCSDTLTLPVSIQVGQSPVANFTRTPSSGCSPLSVLFTSNSSQLSGPSYSWDFGNGQTSTLSSTTIIYTVAGLFQPTLIVTNSNGCSDTVVKNVRVYQTPQASASAAIDTGCAPLSVNFINNSLNASAYFWDFGDGDTSNQATPNHIYTSPGDYTITLIATGAGGCNDTLILPGIIHVSPTPVAVINSNASSACSPVTVNLINQSTGLLNPTYYWNYGNGQTSNSQNGSITYSAMGSYTITLVVTNQGGCADSAQIVVPVNESPTAIASTNDTSGCTPYLVNFTNTSVAATSYFWDFGDGATSTQQSPGHNYTVAGNYNVTLVVTANGGCTDTLIFPYNIHVKAMPSAAFIPSATIGCSPMTVDFNNTSTNLSGAAFQWEFGNGNSSANQDPSNIYLQAGTFQVNLIVTNSEGCADSAQSTITVNQSAVAQGTVSDSSGCAPQQVIFNSTSLNADSILWNFGDGAFSTLSNTQHIYTTVGNYQPYLIAYTNEGCNDTLFFNQQINPVPVADFSVNQTSGCSGVPFQFIDQSQPSTGLTYQWQIAGNYYSAASPSVAIIAPGIYNVNLIVTNQFGCSDTMSQPNYIQVYDTTAPPASPIVSVSVLNNTSVEIKWQNSSVLDLGAYVLYRLNSTTNTYVEIYRDNTPNNSSMSVISSYTDVGLNTLSNVYTYKLQTLDQCSFMLPMSAITPHTTVNITAVPVNNYVRVSWTKYLGCPVSSYELRRIKLGAGGATVIATLPPNTLTYLDTAFSCPDQFSYRVVATSLCGTGYFSLSDSSVAMAPNLLALQKVEVVRSTVVDDKNVLTEWLPPVLAPQRVVEYSLLRSTDNVNFTEIATVPAGTYSYIDYNTDVHEQEYYYRIDVVNDCQETGTISNDGSSILLKSNWGDEQTRLWWTPYENWDVGVDYYIIEKESGTGTWSPVKTVDGNEINTTIDE